MAGALCSDVTFQHDLISGCNIVLDITELVMAFLELNDGTQSRGAGKNLLSLRSVCFVKKLPSEVVMIPETWSRLD